MKCGAGNFQLQLPPNVRLQGLLRGKTWQSHVFPLNNPFGPSSLMPQSEINPPAHMHGIKIKENLNYTVFSTVLIKFICVYCRTIKILHYEKKSRSIIP